MSNTQGGFKQKTASHETTVGVLSTLHQRRAANVPTYVAFIDFETAFPTTFKPLVWVRLAEAGVQGHLWEVTRQLYSDVKSRVAHPEIPPDEFFEIPQGLREGSKLSPLLFNIAVNDMESKLLSPYTSGRGEPGVWIHTWHGAGRPSRLQASIWQYADYVALVASSEQDLALLLSSLAEYCYKRGLTINYSNSKVMELLHHPHASNSHFSFQPPMEGAPQQRIEIVHEFKYLGIPIAHTLSSQVVSETLSSKLWAAHHAAARAGMRPHGLSLASRSIAWKTFVWPHILFYLPFVSLSDLPDIQTAVNTSLLSITFSDASPEALAAEFGILPIRIAWASTMAVLGGRLQTNLTPLRAASIFVAGLQLGFEPGQKSFHAEFQAALYQLQLKDHWPLLDTSILPKLTNPEDKWLLENPKPGAAPAAPFWQVWCTSVHQAARGETNREFATWLAQTDHRASSYKTKTLAGLPAVPNRDASAWWMTLPLPLRVQQLLIQLRALASDIATHTPTSR